MPIYNYISVKQVRAAAKVNLDIEDTTAYDRVLDYFIKKGIEELRCIENQKPKAATLIMEDGKAELPCNFIYFIGAQVNGWNYFILNSSYLQSCGVTNLAFPYTDYANQVHIENGIIDFNTNDTTASQCNLLYVGGNVNSENDLLIPDICETALAWYASYRFSFKKKAMYGNDFIEYKRNWLVSRSDVRGDMWLNAFNEDKLEIMSYMNAWIVEKGKMFRQTNLLGVI